MTIKPHQQQHILLYLYNYHCKKHESTNGEHLFIKSCPPVSGYFQKRRLSQSDSKSRHLKKKIVLTEDLVKLFITNCKSLIFRILE